MSNPRQRPVPNPRKFISSVFDLAYGAHDGSEKLSDAEVQSSLREAGIDPNAAWKEFTALISAEPKKESLAEVRRQRLAVAQPPVDCVWQGTRAMILAEIKGLLTVGQVGVFARGWEQSSDEDLVALRDQLKRQKERSRTDER